MYYLTPLSLVLTPSHFLYTAWHPSDLLCTPDTLLTCVLPHTHVHEGTTTWDLYPRTSFHLHWVPPIMSMVTVSTQLQWLISFALNFFHWPQCFKSPVVISKFPHYSTAHSGWGNFTLFSTLSLIILLNTHGMWLLIYLSHSLFVSFSHLKNCLAFQKVDCVTASVNKLCKYKIGRQRAKLSQILHMFPHLNLHLSTISATQSMKWMKLATSKHHWLSRHALILQVMSRSHISGPI